MQGKAFAACYRSIIVILMRIKSLLLLNLIVKERDVALW